MDDGKTKVVELRPCPRPLEHGKRELMARRMGIHGDTPAEAYRHIFGLAENEKVSSTAYNWSVLTEVRARVKHLRMEAARNDSARTLVDRNKVIVELWDTYEAAKDADHFAGRNRSLELLGKDAGMFKGVENGGEIESMSDQDVANELLRLKQEAVGEPGEDGTAAGVGEGAKEPTAPELPPVSETG